MLCVNLLTTICTKIASAAAASVNIERRHSFNMSGFVVAFLLIPNELELEA